MNLRFIPIKAQDSRNVYVEARTRALMSASNAAVTSDEAGPRTHPAPVARFESVVLNRDSITQGSRSLSFALAPGSFHAIAGQSAVSRTAILRLICLADRPLRGRVQVLGRDVALLSRSEAAEMRRRIGLMFHSLPLLEHLSVFENAALAPRLSGRRSADYAPEVVEVLRWVGLGRSLDDVPSALSFGEQRRLMIARAIANAPQMLLADDPTKALDPLSSRRILRLLAELAASGMTVLMSTSDVDLVAASGIPLLHLQEGRLRMTDSDVSGLAS